MTKTKAQKLRAKEAKAQSSKANQMCAVPSEPHARRQPKQPSAQRDVSFSGQWDGFGVKAGGKFSWKKGLAGNDGGRRPTRSVLFTQDELITVVSSPATLESFQTERFAINPGQASTFPWLSQVAGAYLKYRFRKLEFYFLPDVSAYANAGVAGKIMLSINYDASAPDPASVQVVDATDPHVSAMAKDKCSIYGMPSRLNGDSVGDKFIRVGTVPSGNDVKTFDAGNLFFSAYGFNVSAGILGELHVAYEVEFLIPQQGVTSLPQTSPSTWCARYQTSQLSDNPLVNNTVAAFIGWQEFGSNITDITVNLAGQFTLPLGTYVVVTSFVVGDGFTGGPLLYAARVTARLQGVLPLLPNIAPGSNYVGSTILQSGLGGSVSNFFDVLDGVVLLDILRGVAWSAAPSTWSASLTIMMV